MPVKQKIIVFIVITVLIFFINLAAFFTPYGVGSIILLLVGLYYLYLIYPKFDFNKNILLDNKEKMVALTFDDGPTKGFTEEILKVLKDKKIQASFFLIGKKMEANREIVKEQIRQGHELGVHTYNHVKLHFKCLACMDDEISRTNTVLESIFKETGGYEQYNKIFRAPHGFKNFKLKRYLKKNNYKLIPWTRGVWDTASPGSDWIVKKSTENPSNNEILLLHDGLGLSESVSEDQKQGVLQALPKIIDIYKSKGYRFVKVSEFLK